MSTPAELIQWVECSRCSKWRIIHPLPDGTWEEIPDIWFCEMNRDIQYKNCDAPEEEYKAPQPPLVTPLDSLPQKRLPKSNDPEAIRSRLKNLSGEELQAAFEAIDIKKLLDDEFGVNMESARSTELMTDIPSHKTTNKKGAPTFNKKILDPELMKRELELLLSESHELLHDNITSQLR